MASPVLNLIDPVGIMRMGDDTQMKSSYVVAPEINFPALRMAAMPMTTYGLKLTLLGKQSVMETAETFISQLPPPPMGRMVLLTFPPIYKAQNEDSGPHTPRSFPPIYLLKLWGSN